MSGSRARTNPVSAPQTTPSRLCELLVVSLRDHFRAGLPPPRHAAGVVTAGVGNDDGPGRRAALVGERPLPCRQASASASTRSSPPSPRRSHNLRQLTRLPEVAMMVFEVAT